MDPEQPTRSEVSTHDSRFRTLGETIAAAIFVYQGTRLRYVNHAAELLSGYPREELLQMNFWDVIHPDFQDLVRQRGLARLAGKPAPGRYELKIRTKTGEDHWVDFTAGMTEFDGEPAVMGTVFDITEHKRAHQTADVLRAASLALTESLDLQVVLNTLLDLLGRLIPFDSANIMLLEDTRLVIRAARGYADPQVARGLTFDARANAILNHLVTQRESVHVPDTLQDPRWEKTPVGTHIRNWLGVPLIAGDELIGLYGLDKSEPGFFTAEHQKLAEGLAGQAAVAIENAQLYEQAQRYATELEQRATERREAEALQAAIYRISEAATSTNTLDELYRSIHHIVAELMPANNFYIAQYHEAKDLLSFPYFVDEVDPPPEPKKLGRGLTEYVLRTGTPLLASPETFEELVRQDEVELIGAPSIDWLGVPLKAGKKTLGVLVVQTYTEGVRYSEKDKSILQFVSTQVAMAVERRRAAEALRTSEERYRELVENANDIIYTHDLEGNLTSLNATGERITGYTRADILKMNIRDVVPAEQIDKVRQMIERKLGGETPTTYELEVLAKDGRRLPLEVSTRLLFQAGRPAGVQGIARDLTQRKELEEQLRQAQKMEAVGRLAGGIAHDFNNLLAVLMGYSELMMERLAPGDTLHKSAQEISKAAERAATLTRQLLAFSRKQMLAPTVLDLNVVLSEMEDLLRRLIREDVKLRVVPGAGLWRIKADRGQLEQVILNLALNARDAMPHGGQVTIETQNMQLDAPYTRRHPVVQPGSYVLLAVSDTGVGISAETQAHIFEPFFTTKEKGKGTGLGLATVYGIVKQSGGYIWVYSETGRGTTFKIYLPQVMEHVEESKLAPVAEAPIRATETILLVEDEEGVREVAREFLESMGYQVLETKSPTDAMRLAQVHPKEIHLLLTDVVMPEMGGRDLAERLQRVRPRMKVLYMSGYTDDAIVHHGVLDPGTPFLQKPFARGALERKVREVLQTPPRS
jgi:PAS domain S-box-containing protein